MTGILIAVATPLALYAWARWVYSRPPGRRSPPRLSQEKTEYDARGNRWRPGLLVAGGAVLPEPSDPRPSRGYP